MSRGDNPELLSGLATEVSEAIKKSGARTVFCGAWLPKGANLPASRNPAALGWRTLADRLGALHAPVGSASDIALKPDPNVPLYQPDHWHPSRLGSYLAACVIHRVVQGTRTCPAIDASPAREPELAPLQNAAAALEFPKLHRYVCYGEEIAMEVRSSLLAAACALLPLAAPAAGETVPCPVLKAGMWFRYAMTDVYDRTTEHVAKIESIDGDRLRGTNEEGLPVVTDMIWNPYSIGERKSDAKYYRIPECPFSLGETRVYKDVVFDSWTPGAKDRGTYTVTAEPEFVSLSVKGGTFKVVRVVSEVDFRDRWNNVLKARTESFYAPEIGAVVKKEFHQQMPLREIRNRYELLEYSLSK